MHTEKYSNMNCAEWWIPANRCRVSIVGARSVIRGSGSQTRDAGSEIRWDPPNLTPGLNYSDPDRGARSIVMSVSLSGWRRGVVVSGVRRMNEVNARRARLVPGWVTVFGGYIISVCNKPTRSTQPCIPPGSLNRVPASAGVRAGTSPLPGGR